MRAALRSLSAVVLIKLRASINRFVQACKPSQADDAGSCATLPAAGDARGNVLLCYLKAPALLSPGDPRLDVGHPNKWDSWTIASVLREFGWNVDVIDWDDRCFLPKKHYDAIIALDGNGARIADLVEGPNPKLILHLTTASEEFNNGAEVSRIDALAHRRGVHLRPHRQLAHSDESETAVESSACCSLIGNSWTLETYPEEVRDKMTLFNVTTLPVKKSRPVQLATKDLGRNVFVWYFGGGAVHKGLDVVLEVFSALQGMELHVVGNLEHEPDFLWEYRRELFLTPSIHYHGYLSSDSDELADVFEQSTFLIAPSCSESMSTAVAFGMLNGLIPICTQETGVTITGEVGIQIAAGTPSAVTSAVAEASALTPEQRDRMALGAQGSAKSTFSRGAYRDQMTAFLAAALGVGERAS